MQTLHTPALHKLLGTPVTLDLGSTAHDITETRNLVVALPNYVDTALKPTKETIAKLPAQLTSESDRVVRELAKAQTDSLGTAVTALKTSVADEVKKVLDKLAALPVPTPTPTPTPSPAPALSVTPKSVLFVRWLTQVQALALDAKPGQPDKQVKTEWGENVQLQTLLAAAEPEARLHLATRPDLQKRFLEAFARFTSVDLAVRSLRYAEVHALIPEITAHLG